jgi:hypothetical protein
MRCSVFIKEAQVQFVWPVALALGATGLLLRGRWAMKYDVAIWKTFDSHEAEIWTWVDVADPVAAALSVMDRFGLRSAWHVIVGSGPGVMEAEFLNVDLPGSAAVAPDCSVSYDYL